MGSERNGVLPGIVGLIAAATLVAVLFITLRGPADSYWDAEMIAADNALGVGDFMGAFPHADNALRMAVSDSEKTVAAQRIGYIYESLGDIRSARGAYLQSIAATEGMEPSQRPAEYTYAVRNFIVTSRILGDLDAAESFSRRQFLAAPDAATKVDALQQLAMTYVASGRWVEAERLIGELTADSAPPATRVYGALMLAELRYGEGRYAEAANIAETLIASLPEPDSGATASSFFTDAGLLAVKARFALDPKNSALPSIVSTLSGLSAQRRTKIAGNDYSRLLVCAQLIAVEGDIVTADSVVREVSSAVSAQFGDKAPLMLEVNDAEAKIAALRGDWGGAVVAAKRNVAWWTAREAVSSIELPAMVCSLMKLANYQRFAKDGDESKTRAEANRRREMFKPLFTPSAALPFDTESTVR